MSAVDDFIAAVEFVKTTRPGTAEWRAAHERILELRGPAFAEAERHDRRARWIRAALLVAISVFVAWEVLR